MGCAKEYSYEYRAIVLDSIPVPDSTIIIDTLPATPPDEEFACSNCDSLEAREQFTWSFKVGKRKICGTIKESYTNDEKTGFTFFGPSSCAADSGLMISAYFQPVSLLTDVSNVIAHRANFQYYGNVANNQYLSSWIPHNFSVVIDAYTNDNKVAVGHFSGHAFVFNGDSIAVSSGTFRIKFSN
jgi:hypothetical protein